MSPKDRPLDDVEDGVEAGASYLSQLSDMEVFVKEASFLGGTATAIRDKAQAAGNSDIATLCSIINRMSFMLVHTRSCLDQLKDMVCESVDGIDEGEEWKYPERYEDEDDEH